MAIEFNTIPIDLRDPGSYVEITAGPLTGLPAMPNNVVAFGQMLAGGTATPNVPVLVNSINQAIALFGLGSMMHLIYAKFYAGNPWTPFYAVPQLDNSEGTAATGKISITGSPTVNGSQPFYVNNVQIQVALTAGMTAAEVATALLDEIEATTGLPVTAAIDEVDAYAIDVTAIHKGIDAGAIDLRPLYFDDDAMVPGVTMTITPMSDGAANPSATAGLAATASAWYNWCIFPYTDSENLEAATAAFESYWGPTVMRDGVFFCAQNKSLSAGATQAATMNEKLACYLPVQNPPDAPFLWAADACAVASYYCANDPGNGLQTLPMTNSAPALADRWTPQERNTLDYDGCANYAVNDAGQVTVARFVTTYMTDAAGVADTTFLDVEQVYLYAVLRYQIRVWVAAQYPRYKLAPDGTQFAAGQKVTTPSLIAASILALFMQWMAAGLVVNLAAFKAGLLVEIDPNDADVVNAVLPLNAIGRFRIFKGQLQFQQQ